jgi:hypothetical protein
MAHVCATTAPRVRFVAKLGEELEVELALG